MTLFHIREGKDRSSCCKKRDEIQPAVMLKIENHHYHASRPVEPVAVLLHKNDTSRPAIIFFSFAKMKAEKWL